MLSQSIEAFAIVRPKASLQVKQLTSYCLKKTWGNTCSCCRLGFCQQFSLADRVGKTQYPLRRDSCCKRSIADHRSLFPDDNLNIRVRGRWKEYAKQIITNFRAHR